MFNFPISVDCSPVGIYAFRCTFVFEAKPTIPETPRSEYAYSPRLNVSPHTPAGAPPITPGRGDGRGGLADSLYLAPRSRQLRLVESTPRGYETVGSPHTPPERLFRRTDGWADVRIAGGSMGWPQRDGRNAELTMQGFNICMMRM